MGAGHTYWGDTRNRIGSAQIASRHFLLQYDAMFFDKRGATQPWRPNYGEWFEVCHFLERELRKSPNVSLYFKSQMPRKSKTSSPYEMLFYLVAILWIIEVTNLFLGHQLCRYGIFPRTPQGLIGIPLSPFLHGSVAHLFLNTGPLVVLGGLILVNGQTPFVRSTVFIVLAGGMGLWLIGRPAYHVGASALIFGYFGYLLARGIFDRRLKSLFIAFIAVAAYGGLFWGMLPTVSYVSWEGHLCGFVAGIVAAWVEKRKRS